MANVVITSTANSIKVVFNDYSTAVGMEKGTWAKNEISDIRLGLSDAYVDVETKHEPRWLVVFEATTGMLLVDSVDGVAPTSNSDLYDKLIALIA